MWYKKWYKKMLATLLIAVFLKTVAGCDGGGSGDGQGTPGTDPMMEFYGVVFAEPGDYADLKNKGKIDLVSSNAESDWQNILDTAAANDQKVIIYLGWQESEICQGSDGWIWNGSDWELTSLGVSFMDFIADYIKMGGQSFFALYTFHEPFNWMHSPDCSTEVQEKHYNFLKREAANRGLTAGQFPLFSDVGETSLSDFTAGLCDYCATWYYPNGECSGATWDERVDSCIDRMRNDYQAIMAKAPDSTLVTKAQSFGGISGYDMPSAAQMEGLGNRMIADLENNYSEPYVFMWYVWEGIYPQYLKNSPGGDASYQVMANVYDANNPVP